MSTSSPLRAPGQDGAVVAEPPLHESAALLDANRRLLARPGTVILGREWTDLRRHARQAAVTAAKHYMAEAGEPLPPTPTDTLLVAGHQPDLFHPGVWVKNFALYGLARRHGAATLNLIVDNDTIKRASVLVPASEAVDSAWPHAIPVPFDLWTGKVPYEERRIADATLFASFAQRVGERLRGWGYQAILPDFWAEVRRQAAAKPLLGECFAAARRTFERRWGCHNLEVPLSALCRTEPFAWFACHLLAELPRFHAAYNASAGDYRRRQRIRNPQRPVPDLAADADWLEAPFWGWRPGEKQRGRLFVRRRSDRLDLGAAVAPWPALPLPEERRADQAVAAWQGLEAQGFKVRSRALTTTLYARLLLGDLFLHGIGGGKYDELNDDIVRRFHAWQPPAYMVLSGTRLLPLPAFTGSHGEPLTPETLLSLAREVRDLHYNPQQYLDLAADPALAEAAARKAEWIARQPSHPVERRERFRVLRDLTARLRAPLAPRETQLRQELAQCTHRLQANAVLRRRDYAFCLYPADVLRPFCAQFLGEASRG